MAHPCPQCGADVEDSKRFCGECGAPQQATGDDQPATPPLPPGTPDEMQPPAQPVFPAPRWIGKAPVPDRKLFLRSALIAGVAGTGIIFMAGLFASAVASAAQPFVFLLMIATGGMAVTFYTRSAHADIAAGRGLKLGVLAGFFGAMLLLGLAMLGMVSGQSRAEFRKTLTDTLNTAASANPDPAAKDMAGQIVSGIQSNRGLAVFLLLMMGFVAVVYLILAGIGGAVGAALFGRSTPSGHSLPS